MKDLLSVLGTSIRAIGEVLLTKLMIVTAAVSGSRTKKNLIFEECRKLGNILIAGSLLGYFIQQPDSTVTSKVTLNELLGFLIIGVSFEIVGILGYIDTNECTSSDDRGEGGNSK